MALEVVFMDDGHGDYYGIWDDEVGAIVNTFTFWEEAQAYADGESDRWRWNRRLEVDFFVPEGAYEWSPFISNN